MHKIPSMTYPWIIYMRERALAMGTSDEAISDLVGAHPDWTCSPAPSLTELPAALDVMENTAGASHIWKVSDTDAYSQAILNHYAHWQAAGGLIRNPTGHVLLMFRRGFWDLPKGKLDPGESLEQCALREVAEETGLHHVRISSALPDTWHTYELGDKRILKQTHWYLMESDGSELTVAQIEEDILDIQWVLPEHLEKYLKYTYPNIRSVFKNAGLTD